MKCSWSFKHEVAGNYSKGNLDKSDFLKKVLLFHKEKHYMINHYNNPELLYRMKWLKYPYYAL